MMSVPLSEILDVKNYLKSKHIIVSTEWTEACIAFVKEEHSGQNISAQSLKNYVYQQWLVADLEEIKVSTLPRELSAVQKVTLNRSFCLQVEGIRDISKPAYSQLKQLEGNRSSNEDFSAAPHAPIPEWEAKPTRMLMLNLTDGCTYVQGMEYRTIDFLSPNLPPGIKVLIQGPVECRFGVLLLTSEKIKILGGEVERKLQKFSRDAVLREVLQLTNDEENVGNFSGNFDENNETAPPENNETVPPESATVNSFTQYNQFNSTNILPRDALQTCSGLGNQITTATNELDHFESDDDDFVQNIDYGIIDQIENTQRATQHVASEVDDDDAYDIWQEDEDVVRDIMAFQEENPPFEIPCETVSIEAEVNPVAFDAGKKKEPVICEPFTYLSVLNNDSTFAGIVTVKAFIITVLSKLECTTSKGWSLSVKINDGTASIDANIHDKVLENIIGISAPAMVRMQADAAQNKEKQREVIQAISRCKLTLQNYNCLMDVKFIPGERPSIIKCYPITELHVHQLLNRVIEAYK